MRFVAIDLETANADMASICQIGVVTFDQACIEQTWHMLVDPEDYFDEFNVAVHGITEDMIKDAPKFPDIFHTLCEIVDHQVVACHTHFDRVSLHKAATRYGLALPNITWLDTARVARRAWTRFSRAGYGLANVSSDLGIKFQHHVAHEDARACGEILIRAIQETGLDIHQWLKRVERPIDGSTSRSSVIREGNPDGHLAGEVLVFTGSLSVPRREAATIASQLGCTVTASVTKKTTLLVVGDQDIRKLAGKEKSSKHRKAEELMAQGHPIRILTESDFMSFAVL